jgi:hypothetical protein
MKRLADITLDDLFDHPIWKQSLRAKVVEPNEGMISPARPRNITNGDLCLVRCRFEFADGTRELGYAFPTDPEIPKGEPIGYMTPAVVTLQGRVALWLGQRLWVDGRGRTRGEHPTSEELDAAYARLRRPLDAVFPIRFEAEVDLPSNLVAEGTVQGFGYVISTADMPPQGYAKHGSRIVWTT